MGQRQGLTFASYLYLCSFVQPPFDRTQSLPIPLSHNHPRSRDSCDRRIVPRTLPYSFFWPSLPLARIKSFPSPPALCSHNLHPCLPSPSLALTSPRRCSIPLRPSRRQPSCSHDSCNPHPYPPGLFERIKRCTYTPSHPLSPVTPLARIQSFPTPCPR